MRALARNAQTIPADLGPFPLPSPAITSVSLCESIFPSRPIGPIRKACEEEVGHAPPQTTTRIATSVHT